MLLANLKLWFREGHVEGECKSDDKQHSRNDHFQKSTHNLYKHDDVDAYEGELVTYHNQIDPSQQDG